MKVSRARFGCAEVVAWRVDLDRGRGELQLAVLVELMRREGFELMVGRPEVLTRDVDGKRCEPVERVAIDVPEQYVGVGHAAARAPQGPAATDGQPPDGLGADGVCRPGARNRRPTGSLVADRRGQATGYAIQALQERGSLFVKPGDELYEGVVVGENARAEDLDVNASKPEKLTNVRAASAEELVRLIPPRILSLEQALEFIRVDEAIEVTPRSIRLGKVELSASKRQTIASRSKREPLASKNAWAGRWAPPLGERDAAKLPHHRGAARLAGCS